MVLSLTILEICSFNYGYQHRTQHLILSLEVDYGWFPLQSLQIWFKVGSSRGQRLVEIAWTGQVGMHCSQTTQRDRVKFNLKVWGSKVSASVGQIPVHNPQWTQTSSSIAISRLAKETVISCDRSQSSAASNWSISPDSSTTRVPIWLGVTCARIILAATLKSFASR